MLYINARHVVDSVFHKLTITDSYHCMDNCFIEQNNKIRYSRRGTEILHDVL